MVGCREEFSTYCRFQKKYRFLTFFQQIVDQILNLNVGIFFSASPSAKIVHWNASQQIVDQISKCVVFFFV